LPDVGNQVDLVPFLADCGDCCLINAEFRCGSLATPFACHKPTSASWRQAELLNS
jgi:hypothetical protein